MKRRVAATLTAVALLSTACGAATQHPDAARPLPVTEARFVRAPASVDYRGLTAGMRAFGYQLGTKLVNQGDDGNLVYSPASLEIAFSMLREGARGATARAIDRTLGLPTNRHAAYDGLVHALADPGAGNTLGIGNGLFLARDYAVHPSYLTALKKWYDAGLFQTVFPEPALDDINAYVDTQTHGRIPHLLHEQDLDASDVFALINTVYLHARWATPFDRYGTEQLPFTTAGGQNVSAHMMSRDDTMDYADGAGWQAVRLPYAGGRLSMIVLLPQGSHPPIDLLRPSVLQSAQTGFTKESVDLSLPRWNFGDRFDQLVSTLKALGMSSTFDGHGNFTGITDDPTFDVTAVIQQANITVGEKGTVAAAATAIIAGASDATSNTGVVFDADHPFAYAIVDNTTGAPLFEGVVSNPAVRS